MGAIALTPLVAVNRDTSRAVPFKWDQLFVWTGLVIVSWFWLNKIYFSGNDGNNACLFSFIATKLYGDCRYSATDYGGGTSLAPVSLDTEVECVENCFENPDCKAIVFVSPNPSQYNSDVHGCWRKSGGWTVNTGADFQANMVSVDVACIRAKTGNCSLRTCNVYLIIFTH